MIYFHTDNLSGLHCNSVKGASYIPPVDQDTEALRC